MFFSKYAVGSSRLGLKAELDKDDHDTFRTTK